MLVRLLVIGGAALALYLLVFRRMLSSAPAGGGFFPSFAQPPRSSAPPPAPPRAPSPNLGLALEAGVQARTGIPVAALGAMAAGAPTWAKVAFLPVSATALAQNAITHPVDTAKSVGGAVVSGAKAVGSVFSKIF